MRNIVLVALHPLVSPRRQFRTRWVCHRWFRNANRLWCWCGICYTCTYYELVVLLWFFVRMILFRSSIVLRLPRNSLDAWPTFSIFTCWRLAAVQTRSRGLYNIFGLYRVERMMKVEFVKEKTEKETTTSGFLYRERREKHLIEWCADPISEHSFPILFIFLSFLVFHFASALYMYIYRLYSSAPSGPPSLSLSLVQYFSLFPSSIPRVAIKTLKPIHSLLLSGRIIHREIERKDGIRTSTDIKII